MFVILLAVWFILNGNFTPKTIVFGVIASLIVTVFCRFFLGYRTPGPVTLRKLPRYVLYVGYVVGQIFVSCFAVFRLIYSGKEPRPVLIKFDPGLRKDVSRVLLANSITLTPGTITANVKDGVFHVHALDRPFGAGIERCGFVQRLKKLEGDES